MSLTIYAKFGNRLFKVGEKQGTRFVLRPTNGKPYQFVFATAAQLHDRKLFQLYPVFRLAR